MKEQTLNLRFDKPVNDPNVKNAIKNFIKKNGKLGLLRFKKWVKSHFPEVVANIIVGAGGMVIGIYEIAENMGKGIIERGQKAIKELGKKLKEIADKQGGAIGTILNAFGDILNAGGDSLNFMRDHFMGITFLIVIALIVHHKIMTRGNCHSRGRRVRVKKED